MRCLEDQHDSHWYSFHLIQNLTFEEEPQLSITCRQLQHLLPTNGIIPQTIVTSQPSLEGSVSCLSTSTATNK